jgi:tellurite resistance protein
MRYNGGLMGGVLPAILTADLGNGVFDGAHLVSNFEKLNPGRNYFGKYYDLFANVEKSRESFLEFERWWGGYHYMNEAEIRWIVEQIFVGNRLSHGEARLEPGPAISLKAIRSPIIVFASKGDNITPPQQALNWIADTFADEHEIKVRGQRIIYMVHEKVGHLGIFVSSSIARKEHTEVTSTLKLIEALAPGLYEMSIDDQIGEGVDAHFHVSIHERKMSDIALFDDKRDDERSFGAVARLSEIGVEVYDQTVRPMIRAAVTAKSAEALRKAHPSRASRLMFADTNPLMAPVAQAARRIAETREKASQSNPFLPLEKFWAARVIDAFDLMRDLRDAALEASFFSIYGSPFMRRFGEKNAFVRTPANSKEMRFLPAVQAILGDIDRGGFAEAVIRMMILLAHSRGAVRRDRLEHSSRMLTSDAPFAALGDDARAKLIFDQSIIVEFELERAFETLPDLLPDSKDRRLAMVAVRAVAGAVAEMDQATVATFQRFAAILGLENPSNDGVSTDLRAAAPLAAA